MTLPFFFIKSFNIFYRCNKQWRCLMKPMFHHHGGENVMWVSIVNQNILRQNYSTAKQSKT